MMDISGDDDVDNNYSYRVIWGRPPRVIVGAACRDKVRRFDKLTIAISCDPGLSNLSRRV